jgi:hypothetical protein
MIDNGRKLRLVSTTQDKQKVKQVRKEKSDTTYTLVGIVHPVC